MTKAEELYHQIASGIPDTIKGKMFGARCIKAPNGKAGVMLWKDFMIFKLSGNDQENALKLKDAKIFAPMEGRPMGGWVQLSEEHSTVWGKYALIAMNDVRKIEVVAKKTGTK